MPIKFIKASAARPGALCVTLYGRPSAGKTTLALTAESPALLDFDRGVHRAGLQGDPPVVPVQRWADIAKLAPTDLDGISTVVVDTVGAALVSLSADIIRRNPKSGRAGSLTLQGYGQLKTEFRSWLAHLREMGRDVVLVAHGEEVKKGDETVDRIDAMGSSKQEIYQRSDLIGKLGAGPDGARILQFSFQPGAYTKNVGLDDFSIDGPPDGCLAGIIAAAKARVARAPEPAPEKSEPQRQDDDFSIQSRYGFLVNVGKPLTAEMATAAAHKMAKAKAPNAHKMLLMRNAKKHGLEWTGKGFENV